MEVMGIGNTFLSLHWKRGKLGDGTSWTQEAFLFLFFLGWEIELIEGKFQTSERTWPTEDHWRDVPLRGAGCGVVFHWKRDGGHRWGSLLDSGGGRWWNSHGTFFRDASGKFEEQKEGFVVKVWGEKSRGETWNCVRD